jgi:arylsulfatase A
MQIVWAAFPDVFPDSGSLHIPMKFQSFVVFLGFVVGSVLAAERQPNFLLILSDDHGWSQVSQTMHPDVPEGQSSYLRTPNIDRIGREGLRFSSGYSPAPLCTPTRRSILCGTTAARSGSEFASRWMPAEHLTMPKALKQANAAYLTAHFGKWGEQMNATPEQAGYDASDGVTGNNTGGMPTTLNPKTAGKKKAGHNNTAPFYTNQPDPKLTGHVTDRTIAFMRDAVKANKPFYVQASYYAVHLSIVCREETLKRVQARGTPDRQYTPAFAAMLEEMDAGVGRLLDGLRELGVDDNTYIVFTADNGGRLTVPGFDPQRLPGNHPLTGGKHELYEGGIRVPFVVKGPGIPRGAVCHVPVSSYDLLPTFYDLAGGKAPLPNEVDGVSLKSLWRDPAHATLDRLAGGLIFHRPVRGVSVIRQGDYKLLLNWDKNGAVASRELYRFAPDPRETDRNMAKQEPDRVRQLETLLLAYLKSAKAETAQTVPKTTKGEDDL